MTALRNVSKMNKTELINCLVNQRHYKRYLEIGMHDRQHNLAYVQCKYKAHVACGPGSNFAESYQYFFNHANERFDIVFIDGIHTEEQALADIHHAFKILNEGGTIILHDCMPPDAWHQRGLEDFSEGENWNGTVWKAVLRTFNETRCRCSLVDTDWGCGIIDTTGNQTPLHRELPAELDYELHYKWLLVYRMSVADFLREHIKVFYHLACMGNWKQVCEEQLEQLERNGFRNVDVTVLGEKEDVQRTQMICENIKLDARIIFSSPQLTWFEMPALQAIEEYAKQNEGWILYLQSKGVSNPSDETKVKWRRLMMRELVENWENCVLQLPRYDLVGVNWRDMPPVSHFCGNFWYASTAYLRKLANFNDYYQNPRFQIWDAINHKRLGCEFWIGSAIEKPNVLSLFCRNIDFCNHEYWRDKFRLEKYEKNLVTSANRFTL